MAENTPVPDPAPAAVPAPRSARPVVSTPQQPDLRDDTGSDDEPRPIYVPL